MTGLLTRSLAFTALLEFSQEFSAMETTRGSLIVTDLTKRIETEWAEGSTDSVETITRAYLADLTPPDGFPGWMERYCDGLIAQNQRDAEALGVIGLPPGFAVRPMGD